ncbi:MAG TPA: proton-conducting membrane transporter [Elusimicrobia bacterium]|nr:proton-conducting membrane transporter [Elusimicrobiota bacterium]
MSEFAKEEELKKLLEDKFGTGISAINIQRIRRVWLEAAPEKLVEILEFLKAAGFDHISTITGFDEGENLGAFYHATDTHILATIKVKTPLSSPKLPTITGIFPGAISYERELEDLLGIKIEGLPPGRRYPLDDEFPKDQYPLRKTWKTADFQAARKAAASLIKEAR